MAGSQPFIMSSGITVNGVPLEAHLADEKAAELTRAVISESAQPLYRAPSSKAIRNHSGARSTSGEVVYVAGQKATKVIICGSVFQYAAKAPFALSGMSVDGALITTDDESEIECHECGFWAQNLARHIPKHGITAAQYKDRHGLARSAKLWAPKLRATQRDKCDPLGSERLAKGRAIAVARARCRIDRNPQLLRTTSAYVLENRNLALKCRAQLTSLIKNLAQEVGRMPTCNEIIQRYILISNGNRLSRKGIVAVFGGLRMAEIAKAFNLKFIDHRPFRTHCNHGHEFAGDNLLVSNGHRSCRACHNRKSREYRQREKDRITVPSGQSVPYSEQEKHSTLSA